MSTVSKSPQSSQPTTQLPAGYMPEDKLNVPGYEKSVRFGRSGKPIPASTVFRSRIRRFSKKSTLAETWIAVNERAGTMTFINTYDGKTGEGYDAEVFTFPLDPKRLDHKRAGMDEVSVDECPVCVSVDSTDPKEDISGESHVGEVVHH